jgi:FkbM family methyltransferase
MYQNTNWQTNPIKGHPIEAKMRGLIHVGAHYAQEYNDYIHNGIKNIVLIEPLSANYKKMLESWDFPKDGSVLTFQTAIGNYTGEVVMNVETANWGMSSSILEPGSHLESYPHITFDTKETVKIDKLDNLPLVRHLYNVLMVDVQGYEGEVFKGATETLKFIDIIFTEVNTGEVYKGCTKLEELDAMLAGQGFERFHVHLYGNNVNYGDAIYLRK